MKFRLGMMLSGGVYACLRTLETRVIDDALKAVSDDFMTGWRSCSITVEHSNGKQKVDALEPNTSADVYLKTLSEFNDILMKSCRYRPIQIEYRLFLDHLHTPNARVIVSWRDTPGMHCEFMADDFSNNNSKRLYEVLQRNFNDYFALAEVRG